MRPSAVPSRASHRLSELHILKLRAMATHSAQTTMPSQKTASGLASQTALAIRWGFPTFLSERILNRPAASTTTPPGSPPPPSAGEVPPAPNTPEAHRARRERELAQLTEALRAHNGAVARAAAAVGISRKRAYRLMEASGMVGVDDSDDPSQGGAR